MPSISPRQSSTPCQIGVTYATSSSTSGICETGKNVPEKRNIGTITKRKIGGKLASDSVVAAYAAIGIENAVPISDRHRDREQAEPGVDGAERRDDEQVGGARR